jgi:CTP synthase
VVPHVSDAIQEWVLNVAKTPVQTFKENNNRDAAPEVCIVELGGTLGDIESMPFVEALRQLQENLGYKNMCFVHVSLVPALGDPAEQKTKPTQHSVKQMMQMGLRPDFLCCRGTSALEEGTKSKLSLFTSVPNGAIVSLHDVSNIYRVPLMMIEQNLHSMLLQRLRMGRFKKGVDYTIVDDASGIEDSEVIKDWKILADSVDKPESECVIAVVGKYIDQGDAYLSVVKALTHAAMATKQKLRIEWIEASSLAPDVGAGENDMSKSAWERLTKCDGVVVPGGFGSRGMEGKIATIKYARENKLPYLGICLGMQAAVIEHCRNVLGIEKAHSSEFSDDLVKDEEDAVIFMPEGDRERMGGTMRLGARETILKENSIARHLYGEEKVMERHRHRYEVNPALVPRLEEAGLDFVGRNTDASGERMEVCEMSKDKHPYFMAAQFHPEFTSRPEKANPLFLGLLQASKERIQSMNVNDLAAV